MLVLRAMSIRVSARARDPLTATEAVLGMLPVTLL